MKNGVILLTKQDPFSARARKMARALLGLRLICFSGMVGDPMPERLRLGCPTLVSFLSPWIIPASVLGQCGRAINFHPGSTDYPGIGCYNFALYDEAPEFGAVCHHMLPKVDTGLVIEERRFPLVANDTVEVLKLRTMVTMLAMFQDIISLIAKEDPLPASSAHWSRTPYTRRQLNALTECTPAMSADEIERRVRATTYPGCPGAVMITPRGRVPFPVPNRVPIA